MSLKNNVYFFHLWHKNRIPLNQGSCQLLGDEESQSPVTRDEVEEALKEVLSKSITPEIRAKIEEIKAERLEKGRR